MMRRWTSARCCFPRAACLVTRLSSGEDFLEAPGVAEDAKGRCLVLSQCFLQHSRPERLGEAALPLLRGRLRRRSLQRAPGPQAVEPRGDRPPPSSGHLPGGGSTCHGLEHADLASCQPLVAFCTCKGYGLALLHLLTRLYASIAANDKPGDRRVRLPPRGEKMS
jgi:hypothetical protein